jgi:hypothetical protein
LPAVILSSLIRLMIAPKFGALADVPNLLPNCPWKTKSTLSPMAATSGIPRPFRL